MTHLNQVSLSAQGIITAVDYTPCDVNDDGSIKVAGTSTATVQLIVGKYNLPHGDYIINGGTPNVSCYTYLSTANGTVYKDSQGKDVAFTLSGDAQGDTVMLQVVSGKTVDATVYPMIRLASDADATYEPYQGETYTAKFGQTVYGGELDWDTGELTITHGLIESYNGETLPGEWISDRDVYAAGTVPSTGAQVCYALATPTTRKILSTQISATSGVNTMYADTGDVTVSYLEQGLISRTVLEDIADAIRAKTETSETMLPGEMALLIEAIETGVPMPSWIKEIEAVTATISVNSSSIAFASAMTSKATGFIVWASNYSAVPSGTGVVLIGKLGSYEVMVTHSSMGLDADEGDLCSPVASLSGGKMTISGIGVSNYCFSGASTYRAIMWR